MTAEGLTIRNNELGFSDDNVRSICRLGKSTKAQDEDTTGEKGLGFKSVFTVAGQVSSTIIEQQVVQQLKVEICFSVLIETLPHEPCTPLMAAVASNVGLSLYARDRCTCGASKPARTRTASCLTAVAQGCASISVNASGGCRVD